MSNEFIQHEKRRLEQQIELSAEKVYVLAYLGPRPCAESPINYTEAKDYSAGQPLLLVKAFAATKKAQWH